MNEYEAYSHGYGNGLAGRDLPDFERWSNACRDSFIKGHEKGFAERKEILMRGEIRTICSRCGACADHPDDRIDGRCHHCHETKTVTQRRDETGAWK